MAGLVKIVARWYQNNVGRELMKYGLKLDDVRNDWHPDVDTAISRLTPEELSNRNKRLKRAMDLSLKHSEAGSGTAPERAPGLCPCLGVGGVAGRLERAAKA
ncbi:hypothetical protein T484DRAFT_1890636 [Baffinella frigidus]|nr:hypothetical protein T484DRAFT_1890636 [Cryptophyta sp. CCMP2293]